MKSKQSVQGDEELVSIKISNEAKQTVDDLHERTGRTRLHILNAAIREYCERHGK